MRVELVAATHIFDKSLLSAGWKPSGDQKAMALEDADLLAEFAGRLCYQSWERPNPATVTNEGYLFNIINQQHFSVLEHASFSFYVDGVSRSLLAEITRHRHLSFSVLSQRYVDESDAEFVIPPAVVSHQAYLESTDIVLGSVLGAARAAYKSLVSQLLAAGLSRKAAREAARSVLPNATETKFIVTGNVRAWRDVIAKRLSPGADAEIRQLAQRLLDLLRQYAPHCVQDMGVQPDDKTVTVVHLDGSTTTYGSDIRQAVARDADAVIAETRDAT